MARIAFLGLGAMGQRMAQRLLEAGHSLTVWNRTEDRTEALAQLGALVAKTPADTARTAQIVLSMVTDDAAARSVWLGPQGALAAMAPGTLAVEMSTVSPEWIYELSLATGVAGVRSLDAPVAGSRPQAEAGALAFLVGGKEEDVETFRPAAEAMGKALIHAGPSGKGIALKMMVNGLLAVQTAALAELLEYGASQDLTPDVAMNLLEPIPVTSPAGAFVGKQIANGAHDPLFTIDLLVKDLGYLLNGPEAPVMTAVRDAFQSAQDRGLGAKHISAVAA